MLVLTRQRNEIIMIGDDIEIIVVDIRGDKIRLGIDAPLHIPVHRKEVWEAIKREKGDVPGKKSIVEVNEGPKADFRCKECGTIVSLSCAAVNPRCQRCDSRHLEKIS